jgi:U6 snRNA-associated Sm-like protein LSm7
MSERGSFRGRGGGRGGGRQSQQKSGGGGGAQEKPKKENILDLNKYMDKEVQVKFNGGREGGSFPFLTIPRLILSESIVDSLLVTGTLKGYDQLMNLVLDDVKESMRGMFWSS